MNVTNWFVVSLSGDCLIDRITLCIFNNRWMPSKALLLKIYISCIFFIYSNQSFYGHSQFLFLHTFVKKLAIYVMLMTTTYMWYIHKTYVEWWSCEKRQPMCVFYNCYNYWYLVSNFPWAQSAIPGDQTLLYTECFDIHLNINHVFTDKEACIMKLYDYWQSMCKYLLYI